MGEALLDVFVGLRLALASDVEGVLFGLADNRIDQEQDLAIAGLTAGRDHVLVHVGAIGAHCLNALGVDQDRLGVRRGKLAAARRAASLGDDRLALRRRAGVQRPARAEILALEIYAMD